MATLSDSKIIDRESNKISLADRYLSNQSAGGAYSPVQKNVKLQGSNEISVGGSTSQTNYTVTNGFKIKQGILQTEFKDAVSGQESLQQSLYLKGFNNQKYTSGGFTR
jgi:hypothetical protein